MQLGCSLAGCRAPAVASSATSDGERERRDCHSCLLIFFWHQSNYCLRDNRAACDPTGRGRPTRHILDAVTLDEYLRSRRSAVTRLLHTSHKGTRAARPHTLHWASAAAGGSLTHDRTAEPPSFGRANPREGCETGAVRSGTWRAGGGPRTGLDSRPPRAVITAIWPLLTSSVKFFVDFYS